MGCCCGVPAVKQIAATDFFETFAYSSFIIHQAIRHNLDTIVNKLKLPNQSEFTEMDCKAYYDYCALSAK